MKLKKVYGLAFGDSAEPGLWTTLKEVEAEYRKLKKECEMVFKAYGCGWEYFGGELTIVEY